MNRRRFAIVLATCLVLAGCPAREPAVPPADVRGAWETADPRYQDRYFQIQEDRLVLGIADGTEARCPIRAIATETDSLGPLYRITYLDAEGVENVFAFYHYPVGDGVIRFKNQWDIAWQRRAGTP